MISQFLLDIIFPKKCVCGKWDTLLCDNCRRKISLKSTQVCPICKKVSAQGKTCKTCRRKTFLTGVMVFGEHQGIMKELIWNYKYRFIKDLAKPLSELLVLKFGEFLKEKNFLVICVPISKKRLNWRGFNQSELLARYIASDLRLEFMPLLARKAGKSQVGLSRKERIKNLKGRIEYCADKLPRNKKVVVVDDVYTSGATLEESARVLRKNGFKEIYGLVLSRD